MTFLPVVAREMTVLARRKSTYWSRAAASIIAVLVMFWVLLVSASRVSFAEMGSSMFLVLSSLCFGFALFVGMQATADCLSEEKREGTLGLLFLTDLTGMDIVLGKLAASSLNAGFAFLGVIPMLSLAMLLGGVSFVQFGLIALVLLNTMFLSLSLGVLVSALSKNERKAMLGSFLAIFLVTALPLLSVYAFANFRGPFLNEPLWPFSPSPFFGFACIHIRSSLIPFPTMPFAGSLLLQHLLAWACLFSASRILPNCISDLPAKRFVRLRAAFHDYVFGKLEQRKRHRAELLDRNAFLWLASRERVKPKYAWVVLAFFVGLFVWVYLQFPNMIFDAPVALSIIFLTQFIFKIWTASEVCSRLIEDRRSGALELLLSSPLSVRAIAQGQGLALRRIFLKPVAALVISEMVLMFLVLNSLAGGRATVEIISSYLIATTSLLLDLWALKWVGLWLSLFGKSIERVLIATVARVLALPWLCFAIAAGIVGAIRYFQDKSLGEEETLLAWWLIGALFSLGLGFSARLRFLNCFRVIAGEGFDLRAAPGLFRAKKKPSTPREPSGLPAVLLRHWFFSGATAVILIAFAVVWGRQFYWKRQVRSELNRVQANQLPATGAQLAAYFSMPSASENAFASLSPNVAAIPARGMGSSRILWGPMAFSTRSLGGTDENEIERLRPFVRGMKKELDALHALGRFKKGYLDPAQDDWNFSLRASGYVDLVWAELQVNYFDENFPAVFTDLETLIQLARLFRQQPSAQAQNVCAEALHLVHRVLETLLVGHHFNEAWIKPLQEELASIDDPEALKKCVAVSRALMLQRWSNTGGASFPQPLILAAANGFLAAVGSHEQLLALVLRDYKNAEDGVALSPAGRYARANQFDNRAFEKAALLSRGMFAFSYPMNLRDMFHIDGEITIQVGLLKSALACLCYKQRHGSYPADLGALVPEFLPALPEDPLSGKPIILDESTGRHRVRTGIPGPGSPLPNSANAVLYALYLP